MEGHVKAAGSKVPVAIWKPVIGTFDWHPSERLNNGNLIFRQYLYRDYTLNFVADFPSNLTTNDAKLNTTMRVCIVHLAGIAISESFIRAHCERLPVRATLLTGDIPKLDGKPILSQRFAARAIRKIRRTIANQSWRREATDAYHKGLLSTKPHAVLAEYGPAGVAVNQACLATGVPLVVHFHGYDASVKSILELHADGYNRMFQSARAIVSVSKAMHSRLLRIGAPPDRTFYNPYGVDPEKFIPVGASGASRIVLSAGRFVYKKAPHLTILAFAELLKTIPDARLRMIGDGPLLPICKDLVVALDISRAVTFLGAQPHNVVADEMRRACLFAQHSVVADDGDREGTPVAILEASASELPIVATNHEGIPDVVIDGQTGYLVAERDINAMAFQMSKLLESPNLASELGRRGRARILERFSSQISDARLLSIIRWAADMGPKPIELI